MDTSTGDLFPRLNKVELKTYRNSFSRLAEEVKPKFRGWLHLVAAPMTLLIGVLLFVSVNDTSAKISIAIFGFFSFELFLMSAIYHRTNGAISPSKTKILQKIDHASIPFLIGGTVTPFAVLLLEGSSRILLLSIMWSLVVAVSISRFFMDRLPKIIRVSSFFVLGWVPILFVPQFISGANKISISTMPWVLGMILLGGIIYTIGGIVFFGVRPGWSDKWKTNWGYHEWWHLSTVVAYFCHFSAVALIASQMP